MACGAQTEAGESAKPTPAKVAAPNGEGAAKSPTAGTALTPATGPKAATGAPAVQAATGGTGATATTGPEAARGPTGAAVPSLDPRMVLPPKGPMPSKLSWVEPPAPHARPKAVVKYGERPAISATVHDKNFSRTKKRVSASIDYFFVSLRGKERREELNAKIKAEALNGHDKKSWAGDDGEIGFSCKPGVATQFVVTMFCEGMDGRMAIADLEEGTGGGPVPTSWTRNYRVTDVGIRELRFEDLFVAAATRERVWGAAVVYLSREVLDEDKPATEARLRRLDLREVDGPYGHRWTLDEEGFAIHSEAPYCDEDDCRLGALPYSVLLEWADPQGPLPALAAIYGEDESYFDPSAPAEPQSLPDL